jgi:hypothetical protein
MAYHCWPGGYGTRQGTWIAQGMDNSNLLLYGHADLNFQYAQEYRQYERHFEFNFYWRLLTLRPTTRDKLAT